MKKMLINVFTTDLVWKGMIEDIDSLVLRSSWHEIVNSELTVKKTAQGVEELQIGRVLVFNNDREKACIIEDLTISLDDQNFVFTLIPLKALLNYRVAHPSDSGGAYTQKKQSNVMMNIVKNNCHENIRDTNRTFLHSDGITNMFAVGSIKEYGELIDFTVDWETGLLGDCITEIAKMNDLGYPVGWNVYIHSAWQLFYMSTYEATIRTINQATNPPVVFSEEFGNLKNATYTDSIKDWKNWAYMVWDNGTTEQVTTVANSKFGTAKWFNRKEISVDSSKKVSIQVSSEGRKELNKRPRIESFEAEVITNDNTMSTYNIDWFLGDVVTIQSKELKKNTLLSIDAQITEIEETYDTGEYSLNVTFGPGRLSLIQHIKNEFKRR